VEHIERSGVGALQLAFEQLKKRLEAEGLFERRAKKPLPMLPRAHRCSDLPKGAAVRDILRILRRRFPNLHLIVYPVRVQGDGAAEEYRRGPQILQPQTIGGRDFAGARRGIDRGPVGDSTRKSSHARLRRARFPLVSGVGHEADSRSRDFVADVRASTPSAALKSW